MRAAGGGGHVSPPGRDVDRPTALPAAGLPQHLRAVGHQADLEGGGAGARQGAARGGERVRPQGE